VAPKLESWAFQFSSVKPRKYDQSCIRLCCTNRFVTAAEMSKLCPGTKLLPYGVPGSQSSSYHELLHGNV
jgi:hypothetical protein